MITITVIGLDQFLVGDLSEGITKNLANLYECSEDDIFFVAPENMYFHNGMDQTMWNVLVRVNAPSEYEDFEKEASDIISKGIGDNAINLAVEFSYYSPEHRYERTNENYPKFITKENEVELEEDEEYDEDEEREEGEGDEDIFTGDIFQNFNKDHSDS